MTHPEELAARTAAPTSLRTIEDRVAALEAAMAPPGPLLKPFGLPPLTAEQEAQLKRDFDETMRVLTREQIRQLLRECVTVVKPGETLVVRVPWRTTPTQVRELQQAIDDGADYLNLPFKTLVLPGDELGTAEGASGAT